MRTVSYIQKQQNNNTKLVNLKTTTKSPHAQITLLYHKTQFARARTKTLIIIHRMETIHTHTYIQTYTETHTQ